MGPGSAVVAKNKVAAIVLITRTFCMCIHCSKIFHHIMTARETRLSCSFLKPKDTDDRCSQPPGVQTTGTQQ